MNIRARARADTIHSFFVSTAIAVFVVIAYWTKKTDRGRRRGEKNAFSGRTVVILPTTNRPYFKRRVIEIVIDRFLLWKLSPVPLATSTHEVSSAARRVRVRAFPAGRRGSARRAFLLRRTCRGAEDASP